MMIIVSSATDRERGPQTRSQAMRIGRRQFITRLRATVAAGAAFPHTSTAASTVASAGSAAGAAGTLDRQETGPLDIDTDALKSAERIAGLRFTEAEQELAV